MFGISIIFPSMDIIMGITGGTEICAIKGCSRMEKAAVQSNFTRIRRITNDNDMQGEG